MDGKLIEPLEVHSTVNDGKGTQEEHDAVNERVAKDGKDDNDKTHGGKKSHHSRPTHSKQMLGGGVPIKVDSKVWGRSKFKILGRRCPGKLEF